MQYILYYAVHIHGRAHPPKTTPLKTYLNPNQISSQSAASHSVSPMPPRLSDSEPQAARTPTPAMEARASATHTGLHQWQHAPPV